MTKITFSGITDRGVVRPNNEDTFRVNKRSGFCLVADGMGGRAGGEVASSMFAAAAGNFAPESAFLNETSAVAFVQNSFSSANKRILSHVALNPSMEGMGCTAELLAFYEGGFVLGHIGDSRAYRFRNGELQQLTKDHSLVQEQLDQGLITREQANRHSFRNVILRAVGIERSIALDILRGRTYPGDIFLLCSDGLTDMLNDGLIRAILMDSDDLDKRTEKLISSAKSAGGKDNVTAVLAEIGQPTA